MYPIRPRARWTGDEVCVAHLPKPRVKLAGLAASQPELKTTCVSGRAAVARYLSRHAATDPAPHPTSVVKKLIKMLVHIINAHPCPNSFGGAIHRHIVEVLVVNGHQIDDLDLYAERFDPVLTSRERDVYFDPAANLTGVKTYVERLRSAEALVLCFPTWWYGMPAILKGWFDRVWLPGVAFHNPPQGGPIKRGLVNIQKLAAVTSYNSPRWFMLFYMRDPGKTVLMRGFTRLIAPGARTHYLAHYDMLRSTEVSRKRFLARVDQTFASF